LNKAAAEIAKVCCDRSLLAHPANFIVLAFVLVSRIIFLVRLFCAPVACCARGQTVPLPPLPLNYVTESFVGVKRSDAFFPSRLIHLLLLAVSVLLFAPHQHAINTHFTLSSSSLYPWVLTQPITCLADVVSPKITSYSTTIYPIVSLRRLTTLAIHNSLPPSLSLRLKTHLFHTSFPP